MTSPPILTLDSLQLGQRARISGFCKANGHINRLVELGMVPGQDVTLIKKAPLGDPLEFRVMNYNICIRRSEAAAVNVTILDK